MNILTTERRRVLENAIYEGFSLRAAAKIAHVSKRTVARYKRLVNGPPKSVVRKKKAVTLVFVKDYYPPSWPTPLHRKGDVESFFDHSGIAQALVDGGFVMRVEDERK